MDGYLDIKLKKKIKAVLKMDMQSRNWTEYICWVGCNSINNSIQAKSDKAIWCLHVPHPSVYHFLRFVFDWTDDSQMTVLLFLPHFLVLFQVSLGLNWLRDPAHHSGRSDCKGN